MLNRNRIDQILTSALARNDYALIETEGAEILNALGMTTPQSYYVRNEDDLRQGSVTLPGLQVVVKVVSREIHHKSDVGGVSIVANDLDVMADTIRAMLRRLEPSTVEGFIINEFIDFDAALGGELLFGLRRTEDFGAVVTVGAGGVYAEFLSGNFKTGRDVAILSCELCRARDSIAAALRDLPIIRLISAPPRGQKVRISLDEIIDATEQLLWLGREFGSVISDFEINPMVVAKGRLIALDVLVKLNNATQSATNHRPIAKIKNLLQPHSAAVIGVSEKLNPGHVIVNNLLREGFDRTHLYVIKPGVETVEGCRCYPHIADLPERVDLLVLSVAASQVPEAISSVIETRKAESVIVIPGGLEEKSGTEGITSQLHQAIAASRLTDWQGPVINGGNCLGIRSHPGRYDTMFIPQYKLSTAKDLPTAPVAIISQSGAFGLTRADKLRFVNPRYNITLGNQMDLTIGDYLSYLQDDPQIEVFAVYVEGFAPLDGIKFLKAAAAITAQGKTVVLYRAGRSVAGAQASASHTASIAGDYAVTRSLACQFEVIVADTIADFEDLVRLCTLQRQWKISGRRLAAISNAGFECVAMADNLGSFELAKFSKRTVDRLRTIFQRCRIDHVVDPHNPLDLTPMSDDLAYEDAVRAVMEDEHVDLGIVGCVPLTGALNTLAADCGHAEDITRADSVVQRLIKLKDEIAKPWIAVVDAGHLYDAMAERLDSAGIPTFREADRALRLLNLACSN